MSFSGISAFALALVWVVAAMLRGGANRFEATAYLFGGSFFVLLGIDRSFAEPPAVLEPLMFIAFLGGFFMVFVDFITKRRSPDSQDQ